MFGSLFGTPIINPPQSAILGMHGSFERPVVRNGQVSLSSERVFENCVNHDVVRVLGSETRLIVLSLK